MAPWSLDIWRCNQALWPYIAGLHTCVPSAKARKASCSAAAQLPAWLYRHSGIGHCESLWLARWTICSLAEVRPRSMHQQYGRVFRSLSLSTACNTMAGIQQCSFYPIIYRGFISQVVQDFFHQHYQGVHLIMSRLVALSPATNQTYLFFVILFQFSTLNTWDWKTYKIETSAAFPYFLSSGDDIFSHSQKSPLQLLHQLPTFAGKKTQKKHNFLEVQLSRKNSPKTTRRHPNTSRGLVF